MAKTIFVGDIHSPMTDKQKKLFQEASKNTIMMDGDVIDSCGPINTAILKNIPVITLILEDILNPVRLGYTKNMIFPLKIIPY